MCKSLSSPLHCDQCCKLKFSLLLQAGEKHLHRKIPPLLTFCRKPGCLSLTMRPASLEILTLHMPKWMTRRWFVLATVETARSVFLLHLVSQPWSVKQLIAEFLTTSIWSAETSGYHTWPVNQEIPILLLFILPVEQWRTNWSLEMELSPPLLLFDVNRYLYRKWTVKTCPRGVFLAHLNTLELSVSFSKPRLIETMNY